MSQKFNSNQFVVKDEKSGQQEERVVKVEASAQAAAQAFNPNKLVQPGKQGYASVKSRFGALAATDPDRAAKTRKDSRFSLNPLLRDPLSVEEEERRAIEERVRARVSAVAEESKAKAAEQGYQDGLKKGHEEAYKKFQQEGAQRLEAFEKFLRDCETAKQEIYKANEKFLIDLIYQISKMVLLKELKTDREYLQRLAVELIEKVGVRENIRIQISPEDFESAGMLKEGLEKNLGALKNLNIESSNQIALGGCKVDTEWNAIDASIETQLKGIHDSLLGSEQK